MNDKALIEHQFGAASATYDSNAVVQADIAARLAAMLESRLARRATVLEVGCGTGLLSAALIVSRQPARYYLNDISAAMLDVAVAKCRAAGAGFSDIDDLKKSDDQKRRRKNVQGQIDKHPSENKDANTDDRLNHRGICSFSCEINYRGDQYRSAEHCQCDADYIVFQNNQQNSKHNRRDCRNRISSVYHKYSPILRLFCFLDAAPPAAAASCASVPIISRFSPQA